MELSLHKITNYMHIHADNFGFSKSDKFRHVSWGARWLPPSLDSEPFFTLPAKPTLHRALYVIVDWLIHVASA